jgi:hypothetical protein
VDRWVEEERWRRWIGRTMELGKSWAGIAWWWHDWRHVGRKFKIVGYPGFAQSITLYNT